LVPKVSVQNVHWYGLNGALSGFLSAFGFRRCLFRCGLGRAYFLGADDEFHDTADEFDMTELLSECDDAALLAEELP
jgi:hypothetical protein